MLCVKGGHTNFGQITREITPQKNSSETFKKTWLQKLEEKKTYLSISEAGIPLCALLYVYKKVKWSRYRPGVAQSVGRGIALLFHDRGTRRGWVVSSTPWPHFTPGKKQVPILQEAGWTLGPVWTVGKSLPHRDSIANRPARSQSLYRLSYRAHAVCVYSCVNDKLCVCVCVYLIMLIKALHCQVFVFCVT